MPARPGRDRVGRTVLSPITVETPGWSPDPPRAYVAETGVVSRSSTRSRSRDHPGLALVTAFTVATPGRCPDPRRVDRRTPGRCLDPQRVDQKTPGRSLFPEILDGHVHPGRTSEVLLHRWRCPKPSLTYIHIATARCGGSRRPLTPDESAPSRDSMLPDRASQREYSLVRNPVPKRPTSLAMCSGETGDMPTPVRRGMPFALTSAAMTASRSVSSTSSP
jgi:hypothetical protein